MSPLPNCSVSLVPPLIAVEVVVVLVLLSLPQAARKAAAAAEPPVNAMNLRRDTGSLTARATAFCAGASAFSSSLLSGMFVVSSLVCASVGPLRDPRPGRITNRRDCRDSGRSRPRAIPAYIHVIQPGRERAYLWHGIRHPPPCRSRLPPAGRLRDRDRRLRQQRLLFLVERNRCPERSRRQERLAAGGDDQGIHLQAGQDHRSGGNDRRLQQRRLDRPHGDLDRIRRLRKRRHPARHEAARSR